MLTIGADIERSTTLTRNGEIYTRRDREFDRKLKEGKLTTREVDASGRIAFSGDPKVDGRSQERGRDDASLRTFGPRASVVHPASVSLFHGAKRDA